MFVHLSVVRKSRLKQLVCQWESEGSMTCKPLIMRVLDIYDERGEEKAVNLYTVKLNTTVIYDGRACQLPWMHDTSHAAGF